MPNRKDDTSLRQLAYGIHNTENFGGSSDHSDADSLTISRHQPVLVVRQILFTIDIFKSFGPFYGS